MLTLPHGAFISSAKAFTDALLELERLAKKVIVELAGIDKDREAGRATVPLAEQTERRDVVVEVMETLLKKGKLPWAKATVKAYFKQVLDRYHLFDPGQKERINGFNHRRLNTDARDADRVYDSTGAMQGRVMPRQKSAGNAAVLHSSSGGVVRAERSGPPAPAAESAGPAASAATSTAKPDNGAAAETDDPAPAAAVQ